MRPTKKIDEKAKHAGAESLWTRFFPLTLQTARQYICAAQFLSALDTLPVADLLRLDLLKADLVRILYRRATLITFYGTEDVLLDIQASTDVTNFLIWFRMNGKLSHEAFERLIYQATGTV